MREKIRDLEKENRSLRKELSYHKKRAHHYEEIQETEEDIQDKLEIQVVKNGVPCQVCGKGIMKEFEIIGKIFGTCNVCGAREKLK